MAGPANHTPKNTWGTSVLKPAVSQSHSSMKTWGVTFYIMAAGIKWQPPCMWWGGTSRSLWPDRKRGGTSRVLTPCDQGKGGTSGACGTRDCLQGAGLPPAAGAPPLLILGVACPPTTYRNNVINKKLLHIRGF